MAVQAENAPATKVKHPRMSWFQVGAKAWRIGLVILLGTGLWLGLRWVSAEKPRPEPAIASFMAGSSGKYIDVTATYAPREFFRLTGRDPADFGVDPNRQLVFFVSIETHISELLRPETWWDTASLSVGGKDGYRPSVQKLLLASDHHQTVVLAFQRNGRVVDSLFSRERGDLKLVIPDVGDGARTMEWQLPIAGAAAQSPVGGSPPLSLWSLLPLLAGLLVAFSPCLVHMTTYYVPLFGGVAGQRAATKLKVAGLFTLGFVIPYSIAGIAVGYAGQFVKDSSLLESMSRPITYVAGAMVMFFGLQLVGLFHAPFFHRLNIPTFRLGGSKSGYLSSGLLGINLAVGCLGCVGGSLFAGLLLYSGTLGSPLQGGLTLLLFGLSANIPFVLGAMTLGRLQVRSLVPLSLSRYAPVVSGAILIALGLLILSGTESVVEDALVQAAGL